MPTKITMPALSPTMTKGTLAKWLVSEGDEVNAGDVIAEIETDKATMEVEAVDEGIVGKILVSAGTEGVAVNAVIAVLLEDGETANDIGDMSVDKPTASTQTENEAPKVEVKPTPSQAPTKTSQNDKKGDRIFASPLARRIAEQKGLNLSSIKGSGPRGRIVKADVENASSAPAISQAQTPTASTPVSFEGDAPYTEIPNNNIKKITAKRLQESKSTVPHFYLTIDCRIDELLASRKKINDAAKGDYKLSVNDFIVKAAAMALKAYPAANVSWGDDAVKQYSRADISVAVSTPNGLITPIVRGAEHKGLKSISSEVKDLATRARDGKLKPQEFQGGTFTISNLGMFGIKAFDAILNPPQACILAVGAGAPTPVVDNGEIKIATVMSCTLSVDHRAVDGAVGAEYLQYFKRYIENPVEMLV